MWNYWLTLCWQTLYVEVLVGIVSLLKLLNVVVMSIATHMSQKVSSTPLTKTSYDSSFCQ